MNDNFSWQERTILLLGEKGMKKILKSHVLIVGLGGVGSYAAEAIARAGIGNITIVDADNIANSNINRQLPALHSTIGMPKATIVGERIKDINPNINITVLNEYLRDERMIEILRNKYDYVIDAIDTLSPKLFLIYHSLKNNLKIVSSMGSGGKTDPTQIKIADISETYGDPLARMLRKRLHRLGIYKGVKTVFSPEPIPKHAIKHIDEQNKKTTLGTVSYMPAIFGLFISSVVIRDITADE